MTFYFASLMEHDNLRLNSIEIKQNFITCSLFLFQVTFGIIIAVRGQYPHKIGCDHRVGGPENNHCPFVDSDAWDCLDCGKGQKVYHCAKNTTGGWTEVCAVVQICKKGIHMFGS